MKAILMSIKPKWVAKILNGEKTIEIRKRFPKEYRGWVYIYCTKDNHQLVKPKDYDKYLLFTKGAADYSHEHTLNGKVVARFWCDEIEYIEDGDFKNYNYTSYAFDSFRNTISTFSCLSIEQINAYLKGKDGYAIHISKLEIFDKPEEVSKFRSYSKYEAFINMVKVYRVYKPLTRAPQSWCYLYLDEDII